MRRIAYLFAAAASSLFLTSPAIAAEPPTAPVETVKQTAEQAELERQRQGAQAPSEKDWSFGLFTGVQYDDNVILRSEDVHTGGDRTDWKTIHALFADYRIVNTDERVLGVRYNAYQTFIDKQDDLQLTGNGLTLHHTEIHAPFVLDVPFSFTHYDIKDDKYLNLGTVSPSLFVEETSWLVGVLRGSFRHFDFYDVPKSDFDEPDRSSKVYEGTVEQWLLFGDRAQWRIEAGWSWRHEDARENEWTNDAWEGRLALRGTLPWRSLGVEVSGTYTDKDYQEHNDLFGKTQRDEITGAGLTLSLPVTSWATISAAYLFTNHNSNVESQDYERNQATLGVTVLF
ncbi:MAG TPA: surface lipoprotein assembly modifier [Planctomycetota bacterium]|nr:surface lipoprotein assembly modifier [Planctomycetota bacterium]